MITVIGLGFVGLTTALGFSEKGHKVYGYEIDEWKRNQLKIGEISFYEPNLKEKLSEHINKHFLIVDDLEEAITESTAIILCVGTPSKSNGEANLNYIFDAIKSVAAYINKQDFKVIVIKSTIPPGTTKEEIRLYIEKLGFKVGKDVGLTNNPEFLREGNAWNDFMNPDRIVIGQEEEKSGRKIENLYKSFHAPIFRVSLTTAEYIKYLSNTLLATLISFSNEQSMMAQAIGDINIRDAFNILHLDKRWYGMPANMASYVYPGCGFGGYCLPKDTSALITQSLKKSYSPQLLQSTLNVNEAIKKSVVNDIVENVEKKEGIGILGLAFKPNSNDVRDAPAKTIINDLLQNGYENIVAYDPMAIKEFKETYKFPIDYSTSLPSLLSKVNHVVIVTAWDEFKQNENLIKEKNVFDYRYIYG